MSLKHLHGNKSYVKTDSTMTSIIPTIMGDQIIDEVTDQGFQTSMSFDIEKPEVGERLDSQKGESPVDFIVEIFHPTKSGVPGSLIRFIYSKLITRLNHIRNKINIDTVPKELTIAFLGVDHGKAEALAAKEVFPKTKIIAEPYHTKAIVQHALNKLVKNSHLKDSEGEIL